MDHGTFWYKSQVKPFVIDSVVKRGKNRWKLRISLTRGRDSKGRIVRGKKLLIDSKQIIRYPNDVLILDNGKGA